MPAVSCTHLHQETHKLPENESFTLHFNRGWAFISNRATQQVEWVANHMKSVKAVLVQELLRCRWVFFQNVIAVFAFL